MQRLMSSTAHEPWLDRDRRCSGMLPAVELAKGKRKCQCSQRCTGRPFFHKELSIAVRHLREVYLLVGVDHFFQRQVLHQEIPNPAGTKRLCTCKSASENA